LFQTSASSVPSHPPSATNPCFHTLFFTLQLRFLFPVLPLWNICAAIGAVRIYNNRGKSATWRVAWLGTLGLILLSAGFAAFSAAVSSWNYPGGHALYRLHSLVTPELVGLKPSDGGQYQNSLADTRGNLTVHVGVLPAMTGVSRFGELGSRWQYSKVGVSWACRSFEEAAFLPRVQAVCFRGFSMAILNMIIPQIC
jgi:alpha-1,6-mannosyltransferase